MRTQVMEAMVEDRRTGKKRRWYHAIVVDQCTNMGVWQQWNRKPA
jgi:hypothetical protein